MKILDLCMIALCLLVFAMMFSSPMTPVTGNQMIVMGAEAVYWSTRPILGR